MPLIFEKIFICIHKYVSQENSKGRWLENRKALKRVRAQAYVDVVAACCLRHLRDIITESSIGASDVPLLEITNDLV